MWRHFRCQGATHTVAYHCQNGSKNSFSYRKIAFYTLKKIAFIVQEISIYCKLTAQIFKLRLRVRDESHRAWNAFVYVIGSQINNKRRKPIVIVNQ